MYIIIADIFMSIFFLYYIFIMIRIFTKNGEKFIENNSFLEGIKDESLVGDLYDTIIDQYEDTAARTFAFLFFIFLTFIITVFTIAFLSLFWPVIILFAIIYFIIDKTKEE